MLRSKAGGYVQVKERLGKTLLRRAMMPGETWPLPQEPDLLLTTANAGNVELLVDGKPGPALGVSGAVAQRPPARPGAGPGRQGELDGRAGGAVEHRRGIPRSRPHELSFVISRSTDASPA